jgi:ferredoxin
VDSIDVRLDITSIAISPRKEKIKMVLFKSKKDCCGCAACMNVCPKQAITMKADQDGFIYPEVNNDSCIECGLCKKVCVFQSIPVTANGPIATYAAINKNKEVLSSSASGGIFGALASMVLEKKGVIFGCAYNKDMEPEHICVDDLLDIKKIQGSKYVQSNINNTSSKSQLNNSAVFAELKSTMLLSVGTRSPPIKIVTGLILHLAFNISIINELQNFDLLRIIRFTVQ